MSAFLFEINNRYTEYELGVEWLKSPCYLHSQVFYICSVAITLVFTFFLLLIGINVRSNWDQQLPGKVSLQNVIVLLNINIGGMDKPTGFAEHTVVVLVLRSPLTTLSISCPFQQIFSSISFQTVDNHVYIKDSRSLTSSFCSKCF